MACDTPCITVCIMMPGIGLCMGCGRTIEEISDWDIRTQDERRSIMASLLSRMENAGLEPSVALRERLADLA
ncbi:MAG: DUF1289 domain-containing protein [Xanthobacteraceae bacterium]|nr:DUF1289 domain-containing protein [Xanthobacteraceae bacterium]